MPDTQAFSVNWTVTIQPEGDVSDDVSEITIIEQSGVDSATVTLDTSKTPHALEEQQPITITLNDGNTTKRFDGFTDSISDDAEDPTVTVDARTPEGILDDATAVGDINEPTLFDVIDSILDDSPGRVRELSFDPTELKSQYETLASSTDYGSIGVNHNGNKNFNTESFTQGETSELGKEAEIRFASYTNNTGNTYTMDIEGVDNQGNTVTASVDLPPGSTPVEAFGTESFRLALSGGRELWTEVTSISTDIPNFNNENLVVTFSASVFNYIKTDWDFRLDSLTSVRDAISRTVQVLSGNDAANDWEYYVKDDTKELILQPETTSNPDRYIFREGDNVLKPIANRDLDGVRNFIKVVGNGINTWHWAYDGMLQYSWMNPFEDNLASLGYPSTGFQFDQSPADGHNDIDQINIRGEKLESNQFASFFQAIEIGNKALREFIRTPVTGQAPVSGLHPASVGDEAEVYYPSRGIPQKVATNVYQIEKIETTVSTQKAETTIDFGSSRPNLDDMIAAGTSMVRNDLSPNVARNATSVTTSEQAGEDSETENIQGGLVGTLIEQNDDGTWKVEGEDGNTYDNVRVI